jgi:2-keto-3-deoxy-L-rhamnonate aldolase RhmA
MTGAYPFSFLFMTRAPDVAREAEAAGVDWVFLDLERMGKHERQGGRSTIISDHTFVDVERMRRSVSTAQVLVRINPLHAGTRQEVEDALSAGAHAIMLPMFATPEAVEEFVGYVNSRAVTWALMETIAAVIRAETIVSVPGVDRVHVGLNDLHLTAGLNFMHESVAGGLIDHVADCVRRAPVPPIFGFGGSARLSEQHPVAPTDVLREHVRVGSHAIIVSRTFHKDPMSAAELRSRMDLAAEFASVRAVLDEAHRRTAEAAERDRLRIRDTIFAAARQHRQRTRQ